ncbi:MAG: hypothetical protein M3Y56_11385, partial [Armatimonadota bacterium]|nr:hypothetical protein [Armatimonadota bacterium]
MVVIKAEYDAPWKHAVEYFFPRLMKMLCPRAYAGINWDRGFEFLDKELQGLLRDSKTGPRTVDILVKVWRMDGEPAWVLVHIEIQAQRDTEFPERVYV